MSRPAGIELTWPGKYDADGQRVAVPRRNPTLTDAARFVEGAGPSAGQLQFALDADASGSAARPTVASPDIAALPDDRIIAADNLLALDALVQRQAGTVDLIVADPPFSTGARFDVVTRVGQGPDAAEIRSPAYSDSWQGGPAGLLAMLDPRLRLAHALLAPHGSLYLHVDPTVGHAVKLLLDEIFGPGCFQREIVWRIGWVSGFKTKARNWIRNHDLIFFFVKDPKHFTFNKHYMPYPPGYTRRDGSPPKGKGVPLDDVWNGNDVEHALRGPESMDSIQIKSFSQEKTGYATQKNESVLRRIIAASSNPGDLVVDPFCGSGTTLAVARAMSRRFIGIDTSRAAVQIALRRVLGTPGPAVAIQHAVADERRCLDASGFDWNAYTRPAAEATGSPDASPTTTLILDRAGGARDLASTDSPRAADEVLAWAWRLPVPSEPDNERCSGVTTGVPEVFGGPVVARQIERDVLGPDPRPRQGLLPLGCPRVMLARPNPTILAITVLGWVDGWPAQRPGAAASLPEQGDALIDGWAVDASGSATPTFSVQAFRRHHRRALPTVVEVAWPTAPIRVRVWDVLHRQADLVITLEPGGGAGPGFEVVAAELQVGVAQGEPSGPTASEQTR